MVDGVCHLLCVVSSAQECQDTKAASQPSFSQQSNLVIQTWPQCAYQVNVGASQNWSLEISPTSLKGVQYYKGALLCSPLQRMFSGVQDGQ